MRSSVVALAFVMASSPLAQAATLAKADGDVLVNTGSGFQRGVLGQELKPGDRVMVGRQGGDATIAYDLACLERVQIGRVAVVQPNVPCNAPGANTTVAPVDAVTAFPGGTTGLIFGGAVLIGAGVLIYQATKDSSSP